MNLNVISCLLLLLGCTAFRSNEEIGVVQVMRGVSTDTHDRPRVKLFNADQSKGITLCEGNELPRILKLSGMEIKVAGEWEGGGKENPRTGCLRPKNFEVLKASSGRKAIIGKLLTKANKYYVEQAGGDLYLLPLSQDVPKRYGKMLGKKVIVDVKDFESGPKVVSCILHP